MLLLNLFSQPLDLAAVLIAIVIGLTVHEFAHAWMAARLGDLTAKYAGRLSLNPSRHFDFTGTLFLLLVGFGWGKPVPINPNALHGRYAELKVSLAGPFSNILMALICSIPIAIALGLGLSYEANIYLHFIRVIAEINVFFAAFNLLPIFPLDGSAIIKALAPRSWHYKLADWERSGIIILFGILFVEMVFRINILFPFIYAISRFFLFIIAFVLQPFSYLSAYLSSLF